MSTHTPANSAAIAAPTFKGTAILLIVTHLSLSALFITTPHQLLLLSLELPSQKPFTAFRDSELIQLSTTKFLSFGTNVGQRISFLIVFLEDKFHEVINLRSRIGKLSFPP